MTDEKQIGSYRTSGWQMMRNDNHRVFSLFINNCTFFSVSAAGYSFMMNCTLSVPVLGELFKVYGLNPVGKQPV